MKNQVFRTLICASLLLGASGCGGDRLAPGPEFPGPVVPTPDENGLVTLRVGVSSSAYRDGVPESRGAEAPVTFSQELGDGYVLESTLTSPPRTRAAGDPLREGTTVMIFTLDEDNKATGYQLQEVGAGGALTLSVPEGTTLKLLFYTQDDATVYDVNQISQFLSAPPTGIPSPTAVGAYYPISPALDLGDGGNIEDLAPIGGGNRLVNEGMVALSGKIDTDDLPATPLAIVFNHVFSRLTWNVAVDADGAGETIGLVRAGLYPRSATGEMRFRSYVGGGIPYPDIYVPQVVMTIGDGGDYVLGSEIESYDPPTDNTFVTPADWSPGGEFTQSIRFQKPAAWDGTRVARIGIDSLTIRNGTGDVTYLDQVITLGGLGSTGFGGGREYTVNSRITKRLTWATSNIYWDAGRGRLTFDADAANGGTLGDVPSVTTANSPYYQGVFFKCGSLVGISPVPTNVAFSGSTVVYSPTTNASTGYNSGYSAGTVASGLWSDIPAIPDHLEGDFLPRKAVRDGETGPWYGDICAYLTGGVWRMPTRKEMEYGRQSFTDEEPEVEGWWRPNVTDEWLPGSPANDATGQAGKFLLSTYPDNVARLKTKWGQVISLPPSGDRMAAHAGFAAIPGTRAYYWSGSRYSGGDSVNEVCLAFTRDSGTVGAHDRTMGASVRCVK